MLLSVRENLKNKLVFGIVIVIMLIMVLGGVGSVNLASIGGDSIAEVDGEKVSTIELERAVQRRLSQLQQQGVDLNSEFAQPDAIRQQVLPQLLQRKALTAQGREGKLGASEEVLNSQIRSQEAFQVDGKFDLQTFRRLLQQSGYTPATYKEALAEDYLISQQTVGLGQSGFVTQTELALLAAIINEKRTFFQLTIPQAPVAEKVTVSDDDIQTYYEANSAQFNVPEQVSVEYLEISIDELAKDIPVSMVDIENEYNTQSASFKSNAEAEVAHILIEQPEGAQDKITEIQAKLAAGESFDAVAKVYSEDLGSKELGGNLGVLVPGSYPDAFETAVANLNEGDVSEPVETEFGTHIIKVVSKKDVQPPALEEQKDSIELSLKRVQAEQIFVDLLSDIEELTFGDKDLAPVAQELNLTLKTTDLFSKTSGVGIASNQSVRNAAFDDKFLNDGKNSDVLELSNERAVVLRKKEYKQAHTNPLENVKEQVVSTLRSQKTEDQLQVLADSLKAKIAEGADPEVLAKEQGLMFKQYEKAERTNTDIGFAISQAVFDAPRPSESQKVTYTDTRNNEGDKVVLGIQQVERGNISDLTEQERNSLTSQLGQANSASEVGAYQSSVFSYYELEQSQ